MDNAHKLNTHALIRTLDSKKDLFQPTEDDKKIHGPEVPYLNATGVLLYLAQCIRPDITFSVNLLARFSSAPTRRHWNVIKHLFRYLCGTKDLGLYFSKSNNFSGLLGMLILGIYLIPIKLVHKQCMFLPIMAQQSLGAPQSKLLLLHHLIILRSLHFIKQAENTCG